MNNNKYKVLLVEDDDNIIMLLTTVLENAGYQVVVAETCMSAEMMFLSYVGIWMTNIVMYLFTSPIVGCFSLSAEAADIAVELLHSFTICAVVLWPLSFTMPNVLRAAGDASYTMKVSVFSMWTFRVLSSYFIAGTLGLGVIGVWIGMYIDWLFRSLFFAVRYFRGKWLERKVV